jgi:hypothetical protein
MSCHVMILLLGHRQYTRVCSHILVTCMSSQGLVTTWPRGPIITLWTLFVCERRQLF